MSQYQHFCCIGLLNLVLAMGVKYIKFCRGISWQSGTMTEFCKARGGIECVNEGILLIKDGLENGPLI